MRLSESRFNYFVKNYRISAKFRVFWERAKKFRTCVGSCGSFGTNNWVVVEDVCFSDVASKRETSWGCKERELSYKSLCLRMGSFDKSFSLA